MPKTPSPENYHDGDANIRVQSQGFGGHKSINVYEPDNQTKASARKNVQTDPLDSWD